LNDQEPFIFPPGGRAAIGFGVGAAEGAELKDQGGFALAGGDRAESGFGAGGGAGDRGSGKLAPELGPGEPEGAVGGWGAADWAG
jgi:hypothetical protein